MTKNIIIDFFLLLFLVFSNNAAGILVNLSEKDVKDAVKIGKEKKANVTKYLKHHYRFGEEGVFEEDGIIRTKWSKLVMLSGLMAEKGKKLTEQEKEMIMKSTDLQIDIHTFGNKIDFANKYKIYLIQKGKIIEPEKISANHVNYLPEKKVVTTGFPKYRATVRSYFSYDKISPDGKTEIVLKRDKKKVIFEINFADYK